jgi:hypothetical protein
MTEISKRLHEHEPFKVFMEERHQLERFTGVPFVPGGKDREEERIEKRKG